MRPVKSYIAKRFQNSDAGLSLDTDALARYSDIIDLSIGDTDFITAVSYTHLRAHET